MKSLRMLLLIGQVGVLAGCQCMPATEKLADAVDAVNDRSVHLDGLYRAQWDLTRIGHSDWCESRFNQFWCRRRCCKENAPIVMGAEHHVVWESTDQQAAVPHEERYSEPLPLPSYDEETSPGRF